MKYGIRDVFDIQVYGSGGLLFKINTATKITFSKDFVKGEGILLVQDALLDMQVANDVLNGKYDNKNLRLKGQSTFRNMDGEDHPVELSVTIAKIDRYSFFMSHNGSFVDFTFRFPIKDAYGFANAKLDLK